MTVCLAPLHDSPAPGRLPAGPPSPHLACRPGTRLRRVEPCRNPGPSQPMPTPSARPRARELHRAWARGDRLQPWAAAGGPRRAHAGRPGPAPGPCHALPLAVSAATTSLAADPAGAEPGRGGLARAAGGHAGLVRQDGITLHYAWTRAGWPRATLFRDLATASVWTGCGHRDRSWMPGASARRPARCAACTARCRCCSTPTR